MKQETKLDQKIEQKTEDYRKTSRLSHKARAHLETLKHYYSVDMAKREITIPFHFDNATDLVDEHVGNKQHPVIRRELLQRISSIAHSIPREFKINIDLNINNYNGYNHKHLTRSLIDTFEVFQYDVSKERTTSGLKVAALIIFGVILFAWLFYLCSKHWFGESGDPTHDTIHELIYTVAAVVVWEAVYIIFLPTKEYQDISYGLLKRLGVVRLKDNKGSVLDTINGKSVYNTIKLETKSEDRARKILLISGTSLICLAGCKLCDIIEVFIKYNDAWQNIMYASGVLVMVTIIILAGIGAINYYRDKGPFKKWVFVFGVASCALCICEIIFVSLNFTAFTGQLGIKAIAIGSIILALSIMYLICIILLRQKNIERKAKKASKQANA